MENKLLVNGKQTENRTRAFGNLKVEVEKPRSIHGDRKLNKELFIAVACEDFRQVTNLIEKGADVNAGVINGKTSLHGAVGNLNANVEIVRLLIERGADVNAKTANGLTPLRLAAEGENVEIAKLLVEKGADVDSRDIFYKKAVAYCLHNLDIANILVKA